MGTKHSSNYILHAKSNRFYWEGNGQLSLKTFSNGRAHYRVNQGFFAVEESRYLLLNAGPYSLAIEQDQEIESFCLFFRDGFAAEIQRSIEKSTDQLLSDPFKASSSSIEFFEKTYQQDHLLSSLIQQIKVNLDLYEDDPVWREEQFYWLMHRILTIHKETMAKVDLLSALRPSTREELYRRMSLACDYILAFYDHPTITLEQISRVACVSPNHLLRHYSEVFGCTPHQHITELRVQKAVELLRETDSSMTDISFDIGFNNPVSFNKMFKKHVGVSPLQYRKKVILDKKR